MPQPSQPQNYSELMGAISPMIRQLDRLEERIRDIATKSDMEALRKELVTKDSFEPQLTSLKAQIVRVNEDRVNDRKDVEERIDAVEAEQMSRQDRLWIRLGQAAGFAAFILAVFEFLTHLKITP